MSNKPTPEQLFNFLNGSGTLYGAHFGDSDPHEQSGAFWWRKYLREFFDEVKADAWISVKDQLPEIGIPVITFPYSMCTIRHMKKDGDETVWFFSAIPVTHWRPLPEPPNPTER